MSSCAVVHSKDLLGRIIIIVTLNARCVMRDCECDVNTKIDSFREKPCVDWKYILISSFLIVFFKTNL